MSAVEALRRLSCRVGLHKWDWTYRVFEAYMPVGMGFGAANGTSFFLRPCTRCARWGTESFYEPFDHWTDAVPDAEPYQAALRRAKTAGTVEEEIRAYREGT